MKFHAWALSPQIVHDPIRSFQSFPLDLIINETFMPCTYAENGPHSQSQRAMQKDSFWLLLVSISSRQCNHWKALCLCKTTLHCPKFLKFSRDMLRSVDATKLNGAELLGLFSRKIFWTVLLFFVNELRNILRNSLWFCSAI